MRNHELRPAARMVITIVLTALIQPTLGDERGAGRAEIVKRVTKLSDEDLKRRLETSLADQDFRRHDDYEPCLLEIVRRGGNAWEAFLRHQLHVLALRKIAVSQEAPEIVDPGAIRNLELLTALRRIQEKPDPMEIVTDPPGPITVTPASLSRLKVKIRNIDAEREEVGFTVGGDYRSGRQARWRIVVRDEKGHELPLRMRLSGIIFGGGLFTEQLLAYGTSWETELDLGSFIQPPAPGIYWLEVLYHNTRTIADDADVDGLIASRSKPIRFIVGPTVIEVAPQERQSALRWIAALDQDARPRLVIGPYGEWAYELVGPDTPEGGLLRLGIKSAPILIEALGDKTLSDNKRACLLALLFSVTGRNDPRGTDLWDILGDNALGSHDYIDSGWQVWGGFSTESLSGGFTPPSKGSASGRKIDRSAQDKLLAAWQEWLKGVEVREVQSPSGRQERGGFRAGSRCTCATSLRGRRQRPTCLKSAYRKRGASCAALSD